MEGRRFDAWVKRVAGDALRYASPRRAGRRGLLTGMAGGFLATAIGGRTSDEAAADGKGVCGKQCGTFCQAKFAVLRCNANKETCFCFKSTSGGTHCADGGRDCPAAGAEDECQKDADCKEPNSICVKTKGGICCAGEEDAQVNLCLPKCRNTTADASEAGQGSLVRGVLERIPGR